MQGYKGACRPKLGLACGCMGVHGGLKVYVCCGISCVGGNALRGTTTVQSRRVSGSEPTTRRGDGQGGGRGQGEVAGPREACGLLFRRRKERSAIILFASSLLSVIGDLPRGGLAYTSAWLPPPLWPEQDAPPALPEDCGLLFQDVSAYHCDVYGDRCLVSRVRL